MALDVTGFGSNVSPELIAEAMRFYATQKRKCDEENGVLRSGLKRYKSQGVNTKILIAVHNDAKLDHDVVRAELRERVRYLALRSIPTHSADLFDGVDTELSEPGQVANERHAAEMAGYAHAMHGGGVDDNPYAETELAGNFRTGYSEGAAARSRMKVDGEERATAERRPGRRGRGRRAAATH